MSTQTTQTTQADESSERGRVTAYLGWQADQAAEELAMAQKDTAAKLDEGRFLTEREIEHLARVQALAGIWQRAKGRADRIERERAQQTPEPTSQIPPLLAAVIETRLEVINETIAARPGGASQTFIGIGQEARRDFLRTTGLAHPADSLLRCLTGT